MRLFESDSGEKSTKWKCGFSLWRKERKVKQKALTLKERGGFDQDCTSTKSYKTCNNQKDSNRNVSKYFCKTSLQEIDSRLSSTVFQCSLSFSVTSLLKTKKSCFYLTNQIFSESIQFWQPLFIILQKGKNKCLFKNFAINSFGTTICKYCKRINQKSNVDFCEKLS